MADTLPPSTHFYAIPEGGRMECPTCGLMLSWGSQGVDRRHWNPVSSQITCPRCQYRYQLGIVAWPAGVGGVRQRGTLPVPKDQQATIRQLAQVRQRAGGYFPHQKRARQDDPANIWIPEGCTCAPLPWSAGCPVHGAVGDKPIKVEGDPGGETST